MNRRYFFVALFLVMTVALLLSKALSANIDIDTSALIDPDFTQVESTRESKAAPEDYSWDNPNPDGSDYLIIEDAMGNRITGKGGRRPTDELPTEPAVMTKRMVKDIEIMEVRHFRKKLPDQSNEHRLNRLEKKLTGRSWESLPLKDRMRRIRLASQRVALRGTSIPANLRGTFTPNRIENDSIPLAPDENDVGIIDGLLRLYSPNVYNAYKIRREAIQEYQY